MMRLHRVDKPSFASDPARFGDPIDPRINRSLASTPQLLNHRPVAGRVQVPFGR
jgi:hypothetical protein